MAITHKFTQTFTRGTTSYTKTATKTGSYEVNLDETAGASDITQMSLAIDASAIISLFILSDQDVTLKTNSSSSPADTLYIVANTPRWYDAADAGTNNPITVDVTALYVANATTNAAHIQLYCLMDGTP